MKFAVWIDIDEAAWAEDRARKNGSVTCPDDLLDGLTDALRTWAAPADFKFQVTIPNE